MPIMHSAYATGLFVDGKLVESRSGRTFEVRVCFCVCEIQLLLTREMTESDQR